MIILATYDADEPEGSKSKGSQYMSRKDALIILAILGVLALILYPVYLKLESDSYKTICKKNLSQIYKAMEIYADNNDGRLPPTYVVGENGSPQLFKGRAVTWATQIQPLLNASASFTCPSAEKGESTPIQTDSTAKGGSSELSYGMYRTLSTAPTELIPDPSNSLLLAETCNHGARGSYDPVPFTNSKDQEVPIDGFVVGWDDSNFAPTAKTKSVTRLAFYGIKDGNYAGKDVGERHGNEIFSITADGRLKPIHPGQAFVQNDKDGISGLWKVPKSYHPFSR